MIRVDVIAAENLGSERHLSGARLTSRTAGEAAIAVTAAALATAGAVLTVRAAPNDEASRAVRQVLIICVPAIAGIYALRSSQTRRFGVALLVSAFVWSLTALGNVDANPAYSIGRLAAWLIFPALLYLVLVYPEGRLRAGPERALFGATAALITLSFIASALFAEAYPEGTPWAACSSDCPPNAFLVLDAEPTFMDVVWLTRDSIAVLLIVPIAITLIRRMRAAPRRRRRQMAPVTIAAIGCCATLAVYMVARWVWPDAAAVGTIGVLWSLWIPAIAGAFFVGLIARQLEVGRTLERLSIALSSEPGAQELQTELATVLDDPGLELLIPDGVPGHWQTPEGKSVSGPPARAGRGVTEIADGSTPLALLVHDRAMYDDNELLHAVRALMLSWLRHTQLRQRLAGSLQQLEDSRTRLVRVADQERVRIERDLHDGAQQRLIVLRIRLSLAEELLDTDPVAGRKAVGALGFEIEQALEEVRAIAHGVYPALLCDRGLEDAIRSSVARSPLPVHLVTHRVSRQPAEIELAIYYVCMEALQNVQKHARGATAVWITVSQDERLTLEVRDDGAGFAPARASPGGLRNMSDRIEAVGGRLLVESSAAHGTRVIATVPQQPPHAGDDARNP
jgi:signal transduction histidine kinase